MKFLFICDATFAVVPLPINGSYTTSLDSVNKFMKNSQSSKINYQAKKNQEFHIGNEHIKTTNINILLKL